MLTSILTAAAGSLILASSIDMRPIDSEVERNMPSFTACYEEGLKRRPKLRGKIVTTFEIDPAGEVTNIRQASSELKDEEVEACIAGIWASLSFPSYARECPSGDCPIRITYPLHFRPK